MKTLAIVLCLAAAASSVACSKESKSEAPAASASAPIASATAPATASVAPSASTPATAASGDPPTEEQYEQKAATTITTSTLKAQLDAIDKEVGN